jgi:tRNA A37 threonylcarbamoyladenosine synthetase subunit TsaC/SUA5/YrdC
MLIESVERAECLARPAAGRVYAITRKYWPGPLTIIVKRRRGCR